MANRNAKLIERVLKDFSLNIGSGGTEVVNELPKTGQEHTVYELHKEVPGDFSWLLTEFDESNAYPTINRPFVVIETEEQNTQEYLKLDGDTNCFVYVKTTNKVYSWKIGEDFYDVEEIVPDENIYADSKYIFAILKDFDYHVTMAQHGEEYHDPILDGKGHFLDGTEFNCEDGWWDVVPLVLTDATNKKYGLDGNSLVGITDLTNSTKPIPESCIVTKIDLSILNEVFAIGPVFVPQPAHTEVSYWIYANDEWVNLDNVGEIVMPVTSVGDYNFNLTGLALSYFDFYINGIKVECVPNGNFVIEDAGETRVCPIGYLKGIALPTEQSNHYSVEVKFKGTNKQVSGLVYLMLSVIGPNGSMWTVASNIIKENNLQDPMTLEFDGLHELIVGAYTDTL